MTAKGTYFPVGANMFVPDAVYAADCFLEGKLFVDLTPTAPATLDADGILDGQSIATAGSTTTFNTLFEQTEAQMGKFGRCLQVVASGAATSTVTVYGLDYLGQPMMETMTLNGTNAVLGLKAFRRVTSVSWSGTGGTTIDLGTRDCFGLPYAYQGDGVDYTDAVRSGTQGTYVARVATQTATSGDPRGTFAPHTSVAANGSRKYTLTYEPYRSALYGARHYYA